MIVARFCRTLLLAWFGVLLPALTPAWSQASAAAVTAAAPSSTPSAASGLTPAEMRQLLGVLNDPAKRAAFTTTLNNLVRATAATTTASPAGLAPHSLGAELLGDVGTFGTSLAAQSHDAAEALANFQQLGPWMNGITHDPGRRAVVLDSVWRLVAILALSLTAVVVVRRLIQRPIAALASLAGGRPPPPAPDEAAETQAGETGARAADPALPEEAGARRSHGLGFARLLHGLRRIPLGVAHLGLELLPVLAFVGISSLCEAIGFVARAESLVVVSAAIRSFVLGGVMIGIVNTLFAPEAAPLRIILLRDGPARRVTFWTRLGIVFGAFAFAAIVVAQTLGLPGYSAVALSKAVVLVEHTLLACLIVAARRDVARRLQPPRRVRGPTRRVLAALGRRWWLYALFFDYAFWVIWAAELRNGYARLWTFSIETVAVGVSARIVAILLLGSLERALRLDPAMAARHPWLRMRVDRYYPPLRRLVTLVVLAIAAVTLFQVWGLHAFRWFGDGALGGRVVGAGLSIFASVAIGVLLWEAANTAVDRHLDRLRGDASAGAAARVARLNTLLPMLRIVLFIFVLTVVILTVLSEIGVNIAPLLGGAGIIGVAIGFGSQKLVQDFITGIFLLLENTMQVGDWITAGGLSGSVEHLSIRTMRLRAGDGSIHIIPFSSVSTVTNTNRGLGNAAVSVDIAADEDPDRAGELLKAIAREMREDEAFGPGMLSDLQYWGVNAVTGQAVTLAGQIVCTDGGRWGVQREFMRRMRARFAADGIALAIPVQQVSFGRGAHAAHDGGSADAAGRPATLTESPAPVALGHDG